MFLFLAIRNGDFHLDSSILANGVHKHLRGLLRMCEMLKPLTFSGFIRRGLFKLLNLLHSEVPSRMTEKGPGNEFSPWYRPHLPHLPSTMTASLLFVSRGLQNVHAYVRGVDESRR